MWYDDLEPDRPWSSLWYGYILCRCGGIRPLQGACPACGRDLADAGAHTVHFEAGRAVTTTAYAGAEGRYEDYMYLDLLEREWRRPVPVANEVGAIDPARHPSPRAVIVVQFWSYFETRI